VLSELECAPCHGLAGHRQCPHDRQLCLEQIEPETVFAALCDLLDLVAQEA